MELIYNGKKTKEAILGMQNNYSFSAPWNKKNNLLIQGDNFSSMQILLQEYNLEGRVDFIYIDPPFATNSVFAIGDDRTSTVSPGGKDKIAYSDKLVGADFLEFLRERLIPAHKMLSKNGSIYLHIDYKIGHYVKIIMDEIFGIENFKNDITRIKCNPKNFSRRAYGNIKDLILFYSKTKNNIWHNPCEPFSDDDIKRLYKKIDKNGRLYTTIPLHAPGETKTGVTGGEFKGLKPPPGRHWRSDPKELEELDRRGLIEWSSNEVPRKIIYADEQKGKKMQDIWDFKDYQYPAYPTEKNLSLLKHLIESSSNEDSIIFDFFCGSGTTLVAAQELGRKWIGIDKSEEAIKITKQKLSQCSPELFSAHEYDFLTIQSKAKLKQAAANQ
ncbi:site-specific DNA-methyltransferase [Treponema phagedenis]|uniref:site-specific DNA-methyltransferase n=1 Tax=Treponema phagedenis TaxID=162 RepID=UPI001C079E4E|nr:site-specific DNA-methyltransferase [Treponema phagedenis]